MQETQEEKYRVGDSALRASLQNTCGSTRICRLPRRPSAAARTTTTTRRRPRRRGRGGGGGASDDESTAPACRVAAGPRRARAGPVVIK